MDPMTLRWATRRRLLCSRMSVRDLRSVCRVTLGRRKQAGQSLSTTTGNACSGAMTTGLLCCFLKKLVVCPLEPKVPYWHLAL